MEFLPSVHFLYIWSSGARSDSLRILLGIPFGLSLGFPKASLMIPAWFPSLRALFAIPSGFLWDSFKIPLEFLKDLLESSVWFLKESLSIPFGIPFGIPVGFLWDSFRIPLGLSSALSWGFSKDYLYHCLLGSPGIPLKDSFMIPVGFPSGFS